MYKELLEAEIKKSGDYAKKTMGATAGEGFPDFYNEVSESDDLANVLMLDYALMGLMVKGVTKSVSELNGKGSLTTVIKQNQPAFLPFINMLYWGIQVGRQIERQNKEVQSLEKMVGL